MGRRRRIFRDYGGRRLRTRARLKFLVAECIEKFRRCSRTTTWVALADGPRRSREADRDHIGVHPQKDGKFYVGVKPVAARAVRPGQAADIAEFTASACAPR